MVTNTTIYTRQIYCTLHDDPPPADIEFHNGDELVIIDQDTRMIFDEENQTWRQIPMSGGGGDVASGTSVAVNKSMVIPKVAGKSNFFACVEGVDSSYITVGAAIAAFRLAWLSETGVYITKVGNAGTTPPQITAGTMPAVNVTETVDSISLKLSNSNTTGYLPDGTTVRYMWW